MATVRVVIEVDEPGIPESTILSALKRMQQGQYMMGQQPVLESAVTTMAAKIVGLARKTNVPPPGDLPMVFIEELR